MYEVDTPWNAWPSLHVIQSLLAVLVVTRWYYPTKYKPLIIVLWFAWSLLTISVMTTKQHFVWDAVSALIVSFFVWKYWMKPALDDCQTEEMKQAFDNLESTKTALTASLLVRYNVKLIPAIIIIHEPTSFIIPVALLRKLIITCLPSPTNIVTEIIRINKPNINPPIPNVHGTNTKGAQIKNEWQNCCGCTID